MKSFVSSLLFLTLCFFSVGCSSNAPTRFFLLSAETHSASGLSDASPATNAQKQVGLWKVRIPEYLDRSGIVSRLDADQLWITSNERWAEPLSDNITRILAESLASSCSTVSVVTLPQPTNEVLDVEIRPSVLHFERVEDNVVAELRIVSRHPSLPGPVAKNILRVEQVCSGRQTADTVSCMSKALQTLSHEMSTALSPMLACSAEVAPVS